MISSQYPQTTWNEFFNDPTIANAILDRLIHGAYCLELESESLPNVKTRK